MPYRDEKQAKIAQLEEELSLLKGEQLATSKAYTVSKIEKCNSDTVMVSTEEYKNGELSQISIEASKKLKIGSKIRWVMQLVTE